MSPPPLPQPLQGVRVLDFSRVLAGPLCGMVLGDMGADVVKVEHPARGDDTRDWGLRVGDTETTYFNSMNRNKRSIVLDLQSPQGQATALALAAQVDVVIENFKQGGMDKLGLGPTQLRAAHPRLVYCSISGYDRHGPEAARPGYDLLVQGEAGLMAMNGEAHQPPLKFGIPAVDMMTGMYAAQAVLAALYERERTGVGRHVELALFDCGLMLTAYGGLEALQRGADPPRVGNQHPSIAPYGVFEAQDGPLVLTVGNNAQFERLCTQVLEQPDLAADARYRTNLGRAAHRDDLMAALAVALRQRPRRTWLTALTAAGIPCGEVLGLHEALTSPRAVDSGLVTALPHPVAGQAHVLAPPYRFDGERLPVRRAPPQLGADTEAVQRELCGRLIP